MDGMATDRDWQRLGKAVRERRAELEMTQEDVRSAGGPSTATMRLIEGGLQEAYQPAVLARLERVLQWQRGSVRKVLAGGDPLPADHSARVIPYPRVTQGAGLDDDTPIPMDPETAARLAPFAKKIQSLVTDAAARTGSPDPPGEEIFTSLGEIEVWNLLRSSRTTEYRVQLLAYAWADRAEGVTHRTGTQHRR